MLKAGLTLAGAGLAIGIALAVVFTRIVRNSVSGLEVFDPSTAVGVLLLLAGVTVLAVYVPARRASRVDPVDILNEG